jgi:hypothetical protein
MTKYWKKWQLKKKNKERQSYRKSLQLSKEAIQHFKTWIFLFFYTFVGHCCPPGSGFGFRIRIRIYRPDWIRIQLGSGSATMLHTVTLFLWSGQSVKSRQKLIFHWRMTIIPTTTRTCSSPHSRIHVRLSKIGTVPDSTTPCTPKPSRMCLLSAPRNAFWYQQLVQKTCCAFLGIIHHILDGMSDVVGSVADPNPDRNLDSYYFVTSFCLFIFEKWCK